MSETLLCSAFARRYCNRVLVTFVFLILTTGPVYAQLNFNSGNFGTVGFGATAFSLTPSGGTSPYTFSYAPSAAEIPGFRVTNRPNVPNFFNPNATGALVGLANVAGTYATTIRLQDSSTPPNVVDKGVTFTISRVDILGFPYSGYGVGDQVDFRFWGVGGTEPYTFSLVSGNVPGLTLTEATGHLSGTLTTAGNFNFSLKITDGSNNTFTRGYSFSVSPIRLILADRFLPTATLNLLYTENLIASGCVGSCNFSLVSGDAPPPGLSLSPSGGISGTPTAVTYGTPFTVIVADNAGNQIFRRLAIAVLPTTPQPLSITNNSMPDSAIGFDFAGGVNARGGLPPYTFTVAPGSNLPPGAVVTPPSVSGAGHILGPDWEPQNYQLRSKVQLPGNYDFVLKVTDSAGNTATRLLPWRVTSVGAFYGNFTIPTGGAATPVLGVSYTQPLIIIGGTPPYTVTPTDIIAGLSVDNDGLVTGMPAEAGRFMNFDLDVKDSAVPANTFFRDSNIIVNAPSGRTLALTGDDLGTFQKGNALTINLFAPGSPLNPPNFTVTPLSGSLPPGLTLLSGHNFNDVGDSTRAAQIGGIPTTRGSYSMLLKVQDGAGNLGQRQIKIRITDLAVANTGIASGTVGVPYSQSFDVRGGTAPYTFSLSTGALPTGLSFNTTTGVITGTPSTSNSTAIGFVATDVSGDSILRFFTLNIYDNQITNSNVLPNGSFGETYQPYTFTLRSSGPYVWTAVGLPAGLTLESGTGVLSGVPLQTGTFSVTITAGTVSTVVNKTFTLFIKNRSTNGVLIGLPLAPLGDFVVGANLNFFLNVTGGTPPYSITLAPGSVLPPGLALAAANDVAGTVGFGRISIAGIPTTPGNYSFRLRYADSAGLTTERTVRMGITTIALATGNLALGIVNVPYSTQLFAAGGTGSYTFTLADILNNGLPSGLTMSSSGLISGTPTSTGVFTFTIELTDGVVTRRQVATLTINATTDLRRIDVAGLANTGSARIFASMGVGVLAVLTPTGGAGTHTWSITSAIPGIQLRAGQTLPPGFAPEAAVLMGVPTTKGTYPVTVRVDDSTGNFGILNFTVNVTPLRFGPANVPQTLTLVPPPLQMGVPYNFGLTAYNGTVPVTFSSLTGSFLPAGVSMDSGGAISGTPTDGGNFLQTYLMSDGAGNIEQNSGLGLRVYPAGRPIGVNGLTGGTLANATAGIPYSRNLNEFLFPGYGVAPFTWMVSNGSLPSGMSVIGSLLTGTPTTTGTFVFTMIATDINGSQHVIPNLVLTVGTMTIAPTPATGLPPAIAGMPYSQTFTAAGGTPVYTFRLGLGSDLPVGLNLSAAGVLRGTPTTSGPFILAIEAVDSTGAVFLQRYRLDVAPVGTVLPALTTTPANINVTYVQGNPNPAPVPINVGSTSGSLAFTAQATGASWLSAAPGSGSTPGVVNVTFNTSALDVGVYNAAVTFTAAPAVNSPLSIPVKLTVIAPVPCSYSLNPTSSAIVAAGGTVSFDVTTDVSCNWAASTSSSWITVNSPGSGTGSSTINLSVQPSPDASKRSGTVAVQGLNYTLTQFGTACSFTLLPNAIDVDAFGGVGTINVVASSANCPWTATQSDAWISASPASGNGSQPVDVAVVATTSPSSRSGTIAIAGQPLAINQAGLGCFFSLSDSGASFSSSGGTASVNMITTGGCSWRTDPGPSWIRVTAGQSGLASGQVILSIAPNSTTLRRAATVLIGDQPYAVDQAGVPCSFSVGVDDSVVPAGGSSGNLTITASGTNCPWTASSNAAWLTLQPATGTGAQTISFTAGANPGASARGGTITVAGQNIVINQSGPTCDYSLRSSTASMPFAGGSSSAGVIAANGCAWTAVSNAAFITITGGAASSGTGDVLFNVQPNNTGAERTGTLNIAGKTFDVTQSKAPCTIALSSASATIGEFGGTGSFNYSTSVSNCEHSVLSYSSMINITSATYAGTGGHVEFSVEANGFAADRSGIIRVGEESFTVNQAKSTCSYILTSFSSIFGRLGGQGAVPVTFSPAQCGPPAVQVNGPASMVTLGLVLKDGNTYNQGYTIGIYQSFINYIRTSQIVVNGQIYTVKQTSW